MDRSGEVREFLRSRRARLTPQQVGVDPAAGRRRVPGLRREEVAQLTGVSVDYYSHIERGALRGVSESVLNALARALQLTDAETAHLTDLARNARLPEAPGAVGPPVDVHPSVQWLLDGISAQVGVAVG